MQTKYSEKGQALIVVALAAIVLFGFTALAIDGSRSMEDRRRAQNAADAAALAGALAYSRGNDINLAITDRAKSNGYDGINNNTVTVTLTDVPSGICPQNVAGKDIKVDIATQINTSIGKVIGQNVLHNYVSAIARSCGNYYGPPFNGNALVALAPTGRGYDANGNVSWNITGGGIYSNSSSADAAHCQSNASSITVPSVTVVGNYSWGNCNMNISGTSDNTAPQLSYSEYAAMFPRQPACNGTAGFSAGQWRPQTGADGSKVAFNGDMDFAPGLYCVTNSPGPYHGQLTGLKVTFFIMRSDFSMTFNGAGNSFNATAPTAVDNEYRGVLIYMAPQFDANGNLRNTQALDLRGNGSASIVGTIIAPSADVTMFGNSGAGALNSQIIAYHIDAGGTADINLAYRPNRNYNANLPITLYLIK